MISNILILVLLVSSASAASAPFITKCKADDSKCMKQSAQSAIPIVADGVPELGIPKLDPFVMKYIDASSPALKLKLRDLTGTGLKSCIAKKIQRDAAKSKLFVKLQCTLDFVGQYEVNGQVLILPIEGKGAAHIVLRKLIISVEVDVDEKNGPDGQNHWAVKDWKHSYDLKEKSTIELENLFNGNEVLGRAAREVIDNSSNEIIKEVGPPIVKTIVGVIIQNVENLFKNVPASELTLD